MKLFKKVIYLSVTILFIIQIYNRIIYGFETNNKIITHQTLQIGNEGESYTLPESIGSPGQILTLNENGKLEWSNLPAYPNIPTGNKVVYPYLKTLSECPQDTCFLPTQHRETESVAKGYCLATTSSVSNPLYCTDEEWDGVFQEPHGLGLAETMGYCEKTHGDAMMATYDFFWPELAYLLEPPYVEKGISKHLLHFTEDENASIQKFREKFRIETNTIGTTSCRDRYYEESKMHKAILTKETSTYFAGCFQAMAILRTYCPDRTDMFGNPIPNPTTPYIITEVPINTNPEIIGNRRYVMSMTRFRVLCLR